MPHTQGPWELRGSRLVTDSNGVVIAKKISANYPGTPEDNATLIAAAPELLDALKEMTIRWEAQTPDAPGFDTYIKAKSAIAKAEGHAI